MQAPFQVTEEMLKEVDAEIAELTTYGKEPIEDTGTRPRSISLRRRIGNVQDTEGAVSESQDDQAAERHPLLVERQQTHGTFEDNAIVSQALKDMFRSGPGWNRLTIIEKEAMDIIALKFSRILSGKSMEKQHWEDVVGYAKLIEEKCF